MLACASLLALVACGRAPDVSAFAGQPPDFDPLRFFTGHVRSWGVVENRSGEPTGWIVTDCAGTVEADGSLRLEQHLSRQDGSAQRRDWTLRRTGPHSYEATATDMVGVASGEATGRAFHWQWVLATRPGNPLLNVTMDQWMYLMDDGAMVNRTTVRKLGVIVAEVTEQFARVP